MILAGKRLLGGLAIIRLLLTYAGTRCVLCSGAVVVNTNINVRFRIMVRVSIRI